MKPGLSLSEGNCLKLVALELFQRLLLIQKSLSRVRVSTRLPSVLKELRSCNISTCNRKSQLLDRGPCGRILSALGILDVARRTGDRGKVLEDVRMVDTSLEWRASKKDGTAFLGKQLDIFFEQVVLQDPRVELSKRGASCIPARAERVEMTLSRDD